MVPRLRVELEQSLLRRGKYTALGRPYGSCDYVYPLVGLSSSVYNDCKPHSTGDTLTVRSSEHVNLDKLLDDASSDWSGFGSLDVYGQDFYHRSASVGERRAFRCASYLAELRFCPRLVTSC